MRASHSIRARRLVGAAVVVVASLVPSTPRAQAPAATTFTVLFRSAPVGSEQVTIERTAQGWTIESSGRIGAPVDLVLRSLKLRYDSEWKPLDLAIDATIRQQSATLHTSVSGTTATSAITPLDGVPSSSADQIDARAILLPAPYVAPYEALAARLRTAEPGSTVPVYQPRAGMLTVDVGESTSEQIKTVERLIRAKRTRTTFHTPSNPPLSVEIWADEEGRLLRVSIPTQSLEFVREDVGAVSARLVTMSRPNDEDVRIPANGFSLAGTLSKPIGASGPRPAVVLLSGSDPTDRDETLAGVPIFGQIAHALADAGFFVLRYDKRGVGQSGGRPESAALAEFADDARAAVKFMSERKDVDRKRLAVVGYSEGGWIALMAAAKDARVSAVGLMATVGVTGRELNTYQVTHGLERSGRSEADKQATLELQTRIQQAVISGAGWDTIDVPVAVRRQADTPYFQSFLKLDPGQLVKNVAQPLFIVQGGRDLQVPPSSAERLESLARGRKKAGAVEVLAVPDINHLLVPATTGEVDEYSTLTDRTVSPVVTTALAGWLRKTLAVR